MKTANPTTFTAEIVWTADPVPNLAERRRALLASLRAVQYSSVDTDARSVT